MKTTVHFSSFLARLRLALTAFLPLAFGCAPMGKPAAPGEIRQDHEPEHGGSYSLYVPSTYERSSEWPLVVVCHAAGLDSADAQLREWVEIAERKGVIVLAPALSSPSTSILGKSRFDAEKLRRDEETILSAVRHVELGQRISKDRIFIYGWSSGALPALFTGLRQPEVFRAVAVAQPELDAGALSPAIALLDPHQPVLVRHAVSDSITGKHAENLIGWLGDQGIEVRDDMGTTRKSIADRIVDYFEFVIARRPWVRIQVFRPDDEDGATFAFRVRTSFAPDRYFWDFGDGSTSELTQPVHRFAGDLGTYRVEARVFMPGEDAPVIRTAFIRVQP